MVNAKENNWKTSCEEVKLEETEGFVRDGDPETNRIAPLLGSPSILYNMNLDRLLPDPVAWENP